MQSVYRKQGKYLRFSESTTHTGTHRRIEWVDELKDATVFAWRLPSLRDVVQDAEMLEVEETRTVVLKDTAAETSKRKCKCDFRTSMVGDGCDVCNPAQALEYTRETIVHLSGRLAACREREARMRGALRNLLALDADHQRGADDEDVCAEVREARAALAEGAQG